MRNIFISLLTLTCFCYATEPVLPASSKSINHTTLRNLYQVNQNLYRSEQPNAKEMQHLEVMGIKSILNLRQFHTDKQEIRQTHLTAFHLPMNAGKFGDNEIIDALKIIQSAPKPVLVHCWHGSDRTGAVIAAYRIVFENWRKEDAIQELLQPQFGHHKNYYPNIVEYINKTDFEEIKLQLLDSSD